MSFEAFDNYECEGQMSLNDLFTIDIPENLFAVSRIFSRARKQMNLQELKAFTYALANLKFTESNSNKLLLDKKTLAAIVGVNSDADHLSENLKRSIGKLPLHSHIEIDDADLDFYESGVVVTSLRMYKKRVCITINPDYMPLFSNLETNYLTMWSGDIYKMRSDRSIIFYELLRENTDSRLDVNEATIGIKKFKELFNIPESGKGSYMRKDSGFNRSEFEKKVIDPLCEDLSKSRMITLVVMPNGKYYEKVKLNGRVRGYKFFWLYTSHPAVATATEVKTIQKRVDEDPELLKVAKDLVNGKKKSGNKTKFNNFDGRNYSDKKMQELEKKLLGK